MQRDLNPPFVDQALVLDRRHADVVLAQRGNDDRKRRRGLVEGQKLNFDIVTERRYVPFAADGFARTIASITAMAFAAMFSAENDFLPIGACTMPACNATSRLPSTRRQ